MTTESEEETVVFHLKMTTTELADWLAHCRENNLDPRRRAREVLMLEAYK